MKFKNLSTFLLIIVCLFVTGCSSNKTKEVATLDEFSNIASNKNLVVSDNTDTYSNVDYILEAKIATYDDIKIEMIKYTDEEYATKAQDNHIENFKLRRSTGAHEAKDTGKNYYSYQMVSNKRYMFSIRVEETLIFGSVLLDNKNFVEEIINELGY